MVILASPRICRIVRGGICLLLAAAPPLAADPVSKIDSLVAAGAGDSAAVLIPPLLEAAVARGDSTAIARLLILRGRIELSRSAVAAESTLETARRIAEAARDTARWSDALGFKGIAATFLGRYDEAIALNEKRLALTRRAGDRIGEAWAHTGLGYLRLRTGEFAQARQEYECSAGLFRAANDRRAELTALVGLGRALNALQRTDEARDVYRRALQTAREIEDPHQESDAINNLGSLEYRYGDMALAARYFRQAYELNRSLGHARGTIIPAANLALARSYLGQYADAAAILADALRTCEERGFQDLIGMVLCTMGQVRLSQGRVNESASLYRRALALGGGLTARQRSDAVFGLARSLAAADSAQAAADALIAGLAAGPLPEFEPLMGQMLARCLRRLGWRREALERALAAMRSAEVTEDHGIRFLCAIELSAAYREIGDPRSSYDWYLLGIDELDRIRRSTEAYEWREAHGRIRQVVDGGSVLLDYPPESTRAERLETLFDVIQRFKARTLAERITEPRRRSDPASRMETIAPVGLHEFRSEVLRPGELFLDFAVGDSTAFLFAATRDSCRLVRLPGRNSDLPDRISFYLETIGSPPTQTAHMRVTATQLDRIGTSVYSRLLGPVDGLVRSADRIIVAPDAFLGAVPFGVLPVPGARSGTLLTDIAEIQYVPSATVLTWLRRQPESDQTTAATHPVLALVPAGDGRLGGVRREIDTLRRKLRGVRVVEGKPDLANLSTETDAIEVCHVAAHIVVNNEKPWFSGILLDPAEDAGEKPPLSVRSDGRAEDFSIPVDPYLRAGEIARERIPARLAVLAGCESALGRTSSGEGVLGLASAFLSAGVRAVAAASWPVDDEATADLMAVFYERLADGRTATAALRDAQTAIRNDPATAHPFYWAGFIITGDGTAAVDIERSARLPAGTIPVAAVCIVLIMLTIWRIRATRARRTGQRL